MLSFFLSPSPHLHSRLVPGLEMDVRRTDQESRLSVQDCEGKAEIEGVGEESNG